MTNRITGYAVQYNDPTKDGRGLTLDRHPTLTAARTAGRNLRLERADIAGIVINEIEMDEMIPGFGMAIHNEIEVVE